HEADDDMGYDPSDVAFTEWLGSKNFNYKTMDHYTKKALWIYWIRGDDEVELTDEESSDDMDEVAETYLLWTLRDSRPMKITRMIRSMNGTRTYHGSMRSHGLTLDWKNDGYCNGRNLPRTYIIENQLHYQDYEWYEALEESELKDEASISSNNERMESKYENPSNTATDSFFKAYDIRNIEKENGQGQIKSKNNDKDDMRPHKKICTTEKFEAIKYSLGPNEEYLAIRRCEYDIWERNEDSVSHKKFFKKRTTGRR
ncbi:hypothetical protein Tco_0880592, partial [Tanacetum coccineum]